MSAATGSGSGGGPRTVGEALARGWQAGVDRLDLQLLLARALDRPRTWLLAHDEAELTAAQAAAFTADLGRRRAGEPLAYILGCKEFHGLSLIVDRRVLVPRPDTELLVDWAIERLAVAGASRLASADGDGDGDAAAAAAGAAREGAAGTAATAAAAVDARPNRPLEVLDLGTGSGAIALAIRHACPEVRVLATDASRAALDVAALNAQRLGLPIGFAEGSWWAAVAQHPARFDLIVSNPPYIAAGDDHLRALGHEPEQALTPGGDGLDGLRTIAAGAAAHLQPSGWLLLEHGHDQGAAVRELLCSHRFEAVQTRRDIAGRERCTGGRAAAQWPGDRPLKA